MAALAFERRTPPIGNTFLNVCEAESEQETHFKMKAIRQLPGRRHRRGHSISGGYIPFALRSAYSGRRQQGTSHPGTASTAVQQARLEADAAQSPASSSNPSPIATDVSGQHARVVWPDTDQDSGSPSPHASWRGTERARTAPAEILASICAHLLANDQLYEAQGAGDRAAVVEPVVSNQSEHIRGNSNTEAAVALPSLLGRVRCGLPASQSSCNAESKAVQSQLLPSNAEERETDNNSQVMGAIGSNASNATNEVDQPRGHPEIDTTKESEVLPLAMSHPMLRQSLWQAMPWQSPELQQVATVPSMASVPATPPGCFINTRTSVPETQCDHGNSSTEEPNQDVTTLMIRNLPTSLSQSALIEELDASGFAGLYDFVYMPSVFDTGEGKGFAFVNLVSVAAAGALVGKWHKSRRFGIKINDPSLNLSPAAVQGFAANVKKWNAPRMRRVRNPNLRPFVVSDPTKPIADAPAAVPATPSSRAEARKSGHAPKFNSDPGQRSAPSAAIQLGTAAQQGVHGSHSFQPTFRHPCDAGTDLSPHSPACQNPDVTAAASARVPGPSLSLHQQLAEAPPHAHDLSTLDQMIKSCLPPAPQLASALAHALDAPTSHQVHNSIGLTPGQQPLPRAENMTATSPDSACGPHAGVRYASFQYLTACPSSSPGMLSTPSPCAPAVPPRPPVFPHRTSPWPVGQSPEAVPLADPSLFPIPPQHYQANLPSCGFA